MLDKLFISALAIGVTGSILAVIAIFLSLPYSSFFGLGFRW